MVAESRPVSAQRLMRDEGDVGWERAWGMLRDDGCYPDFGNGFTGVHKPMFSRLFSLDTCSLLCVSSVQFSSVAQLCPTLCNPMDHSTPGLPVHHQLPEFTQTHIHRVSDTIQPSHPLSSPFPPAPNPSQHQSLFQ